MEQVHKSAKTSDPRGAYVAIATRQFAAHGYSGASLASLAKQAGVSKQALLHFFGTKEKLYAEVLEKLSERLCAQIDAAAKPDPADQLLQYFLGFFRMTLAEQDDVRLVVRALLESSENARKWPLKPYLDRLIEVALQTEGGRTQSRSQAMAWISQLIGTIQYLCIARPAVTGMYGTETFEEMAKESEENIASAVRKFVNS